MRIGSGDGSATGMLQPVQVALALDSRSCGPRIGTLQTSTTMYSEINVLHTTSLEGTNLHFQ